MSHPGPPKRPHWLWTELKTLAVPVLSYWGTILVSLGLFTLLLFLSGQLLDPAGAVVMAGFWFATLFSVAVGQLCAILRLRFWVVWLVGSVLWGLLWGAVILFTYGGLIPLVGVAGITLFLFPFFMPCGVFSLRVHMGIFATWLPTVYFVACILVLSELGGLVENWFAGSKYAIWSWYTAPFLFLGVALLLAFLASRERHRLHRWQFSDKGPDVPMQIRKHGLLASFVPGCGSIALMAALAIALSCGAGLVAPYLWRTGPADSDSQSRRESDPREPSEVGPDDPSSQGQQGSTQGQQGASQGQQGSSQGQQGSTQGQQGSTQGQQGSSQGQQGSTQGQQGSSQGQQGSTQGQQGASQGQQGSSQGQQGSSQGQQGSSQGQQGSSQGQQGSSQGQQGSSQGQQGSSQGQQGSSQGQQGSSQGQQGSSQGQQGSSQGQQGSSQGQQGSSETPPPPSEIAEEVVKNAGISLFFLLLLVVLSLLLIGVFGPPVRRTVLLRHLRVPFWPVPPTKQVQNSWRIVEISLGDKGLHRAPGDSATTLAARAEGHLPADLNLEDLRRCAVLVDRVLYGYGMNADDTDLARRTADMAYQAVWSELSEWRKLRAVYRPL